MYSFMRKGNLHGIFPVFLALFGHLYLILCGGHERALRMRRMLFLFFKDHDLALAKQFAGTIFYKPDEISVISRFYAKQVCPVPVDFVIACSPAGCPRLDDLILKPFFPTISNI